MTIDKSLEEAVFNLTSKMKLYKIKEARKCSWKIINEQANELYIKYDTHALVNGCDECSGYKTNKSCYYIGKK